MKCLKRCVIEETYEFARKSPEKAYSQYKRRKEVV